MCSSEHLNPLPRNGSDESYLMGQQIHVLARCILDIHVLCADCADMDVLGTPVQHTDVQDDHES